MSSPLPERVNTFGQDPKRRCGAPDWCRFKWRAIDGIAAEPVRRVTCQGSALGVTPHAKVD